MQQTRMIGRMLAVAGFVLLGAFSSNAGVVDFDSAFPAGPAIFAGAGNAQALSTMVDGVTVSFSGGVILTKTANLPADQTSVYGTANFANSSSQSGYTNPITVTFSAPITNFFLDVFNGETSNVSYMVADNNGNSASFNLVPNLSGGQHQVGFAATGTMVTISATTGLPGFDFFIDNLHFDEPLPPNLTPEPSTITLLGAGFAGLLGLARRRALR